MIKNSAERHQRAQGRKAKCTHPPRLSIGLRMFVLGRYSENMNLLGNGEGLVVELLDELGSHLV